MKKKKKKSEKKTNKTNKTKKTNTPKKTNWRVVITSLVALGCLILMFLTKEWLFIVPAVILIILNKRELNKESKNE